MGNNPFMSNSDQSSEPLEIESKFPVTDLATVEKILAAQNAYLTAPRVYENNIRYENAGQSLGMEHRVLRLRQDTRARLTYKEPSPIPVEGAQARVELEVTVSDFAVMAAILGRLGYTPAWRYEKYRTTYRFRRTEVTLDELPYGSFVEIEGPLDAIGTVSALLGLDDRKRVKSSYSDLFFQLKASMNLPFNDLTFENFKGIQLPDRWYDEQSS